MGSSPRGRGKRAHAAHRGARQRLIPARAGKTLPMWPAVGRLRAHPRAGGENTSSRCVFMYRLGSSPRGRGKLGRVRRTGQFPGLIPARAGKTWTAAKVAKAGDRLIPARAGKTWSPRSCPSRAGAHPRAGGENDVSTGKQRRYVGSSPRGRGKRMPPRSPRPPGRLIPARAGKTQRAWCRRRPAPAHPRAGGENPPWGRKTPAGRGSSPRGRGKHFLTCAFIERIGQILETLELAVSSGSYSLCDVYATDAPQDQARNTGLALPSSRAAS